MRYQTVDTVTFTDRNGVSHAVKEMREIRTFETALELPAKEDLFIDELITRKEYYGDNQEDLTYAVADHNIVKLTESDFQVSGLSTIKLPIIEDEF
jgi:hypothetical protein